MTNKVDLEEFEAMLNIAWDYYNDISNTRLKHQDLLFDLITETRSRIRHVELKDLIFDYQELHDLVWQEQVGYETAKQRVKNHLSKAIDSLNNDEVLVERLKEAGFTSKLIMAIDESCGGAKNRSYVKLTLSNQGTSTNTITKSDIKYFVVHLPKIPFLLRPFVKVNLAYTVVLRLLITIAVLFLGSFFTIIFNISTITTTSFLVCSLLMLTCSYVYYLLAGLVDSGVIPISEFLLPVKVKNAFLVLDRNEKGLYAKLVVYDAECSKCGDVIQIVKDRKEFNGRYVGKCSIAPAEHIFSFDHVLKKGNNLRK